MWKTFALCTTLLVCGTFARAAEEAPLTPLEQKFVAMLTDTALAGKFSIDDGGDDALMERYEIQSVKKIKGDSWLVTARIRYGARDVTIPCPVEVRWAGDTPMIQLTKTTIPGLGTFSARVMFYEGRYAGTWQHDEAGGHMWGILEPVTKPTESPRSETPKPEPK